MAVAAGCAQRPEPPARPPAQVGVARPVRGQVIEWDSYTARLVAIEEVQVRARVSGYLERIAFRDGQMVAAGDLLFVIDKRPFAIAKQAAEARRKQVEADLTLAQRELERSEKLVQRNATSLEERDIREADVLRQQANMASAEAAIADAELDLKYTEIRAPIAGRVSDRAVTVGNLVTQDQTLLTTIVSVDPIHALLYANQRQFLKYLRLDRAGKRPSSRDTPNPVLLKLDDEQSFAHVGRIDFVDNQLDRATATMQGRAVFDNPDGVLTPGLFGELLLLGDAPYDALMVPDAALQQSQTDRFLLVLDGDGVVQRRTVETGPLRAGLRVVRTGLEAEDRVIVSGIQGAAVDQKAEATPEPIELDTRALARDNHLADIPPAVMEKLRGMAPAVPAEPATGTGDADPAGVPEAGVPEAGAPEADAATARVEGKAAAEPTAPTGETGPE